MKVIILIFVLCGIYMWNAYSMDVISIVEMRQNERKKMENLKEKKNYNREEALEVLNRYATGQASFSDAVEVLEQMSENSWQLSIVELPWWKTRSSDVRKLLMLYYYERMGFRMVGVRPPFEADIKKRKDAVQCREEFEEVAHYLQYDAPLAHYDKELETKAIRHMTQNAIKEIYDSICLEVSEFKAEPTKEEEGEYERALENRIIAATHVIYLFGGDSSNDVKTTMEVISEALATLLCTNKLDDELLEIGWVRANMPNVRIAYLLAYYLLYGDKSDCKYKQLRNYINHFIDSEERIEEIQQVQAFIDNR